MKTFENELPAGYTTAKTIDAANAKIGIIMNLVALLITVPFLVLAFVLIKLPNYDFKLGIFRFEYSWLVFLILLVMLCSYVVLHELVHGAAYKLLTGQKLTFGLTFTVAFCGVPHIYVYRKAAIISAAAPLVIFTIVFGALAATMYFVNTVMFVIVSAIFALHIGGCCGDMYMIMLLLFKYRDPATLVNDTGPKQTFYIPSGAEEI